MLTFWHWLTTSKYERGLEAQIKGLERDRELLVNQILRLQEALIPQLRATKREEPMKTAGDIVRQRRERETQKTTPVVTNWMQSRDRLEHSSDETGARFERAEQAHKEL